jgi:hypothetical protein
MKRTGRLVTLTVAIRARPMFDKSKVKCCNGKKGRSLC